LFIEITAPLSASIRMTMDTEPREDRSTVSSGKKFTTLIVQSRNW